MAKGNKNSIHSKCEQILAILQVENDLAKSGDNICDEVLAVNLLIKGLVLEVDNLVEMD